MNSVIRRTIVSTNIGPKPDMLNPDLTASWEKGLDMVAKKEIKSEIFMEKLEKYISSKIDKLVLR